jgi:hypothetical protein
MPSSQEVTKPPQILAMTTDLTRAEVSRHCKHYEEAAPESVGERYCQCGMPMAADGRCPEGHRWTGNRMNRRRSW